MTKKAKRPFSFCLFTDSVIQSEIFAVLHQNLVFDDEV